MGGPTEIQMTIFPILVAIITGFLVGVALNFTLERNPK